MRRSRLDPDYPGSRSVARAHLTLVTPPSADFRGTGDPYTGNVSVFEDMKGSELSAAKEEAFG
jgi:hypothetical protein